MPVAHLYQILAEQTKEWRESGYFCERFPAIGEILQYQFADETGRDLRFLRPPQSVRWRPSHHGRIRTRTGPALLRRMAGQRLRSEGPAIKLACEHIGVERIAADSYFNGKLGQKLVKIIPFEHPLSPLDLEELKRELEARPETENPIVFVCLGIELAARTWIEDWNRHRERKKGEHKEKLEINKIEVIELRTDAKYGNFIKHEPATAKVSIARTEDKIRVVIEDFISPTILKRLDMDMPLFKAKVTDWRSQVDCVMIDTAYDGQVFNVALTDVPERKNDLIEGTYTLPAPSGKTPSGFQGPIRCHT